MSSPTIGAPLATVPASAVAKHRVMRHSPRLLHPTTREAEAGESLIHPPIPLSRGPLGSLRMYLPE